LVNGVVPEGDIFESAEFQKLREKFNDIFNPETVSTPNSDIVLTPNTDF